MRPFFSLNIKNSQTPELQTPCKNYGQKNETLKLKQPTGFEFAHGYLTEIFFIFHLFQIRSFVFVIDHDGKYRGTNLCRYGGIVHAKPFQQHAGLLA